MFFHTSKFQIGFNLFSWSFSKAPGVRYIGPFEYIRF